MAKTTDILIGGVLTQVTEFDHTAQAIDDAVSIVGTSPAETRLNIGAASNPNLLDNWYFADPIDQRGGYVVIAGAMGYTDSGLTNPSGGIPKAWTVVELTSSYAMAYHTEYPGLPVYFKPDDVVRGYCGGGTYSIDRWKKDGSNTVVLVTDDGYGLIPEVGDKGFYQPFENPKDILNQIVTLSIFVKAENTAQVKIGFGGGGGYCEPVEIGTEWTIVQFTHTFTTGASFAVHSMTAGEKIIVKAAKLELGSVQTLAHQDTDGNWVLDEIPNYAEELAKCKRYFERGRVGSTVPLPNSGVYFMPGHRFEVEKRATPNVRIFGWHHSTPENLVEGQLTDANGLLTTQTFSYANVNKYGIESIRMSDPLSTEFSYQYVYEASADL